MQAPMWTIESLLGVSVPEFDKVCSSSKRLYMPQILSGHARDGLVTLADLDRLLRTRPLVSPLVRIVHNGKRLPVELFTTASGPEPDAVRYVDSLKLFRCLRDGGSVIIRDMHRYWPPITRLSWDLSRELGCAVTVNGYLTPPHRQGFKPHFDYHDIIVIQIAGTKEWAEFDVNAELPLDNNNWRTIAESVNPTLPGDNPAEIGSHLLSPGDVLFVPRGGSHAVRSRDELTFHLTLEVQQWTHFDVGAALLQRVSQSRELRESLEAGGYRGGALRRETIDASVGRIKDFAERLPERDVSWELYRESHRDLFESPLSIVRQFEILNGLSETSVLVRRDNLIVAIQPGQQTTQIRLRDRTLRFPAAHHDAVALAMSGEPVTARRCADQRTSLKQAAQILKVLASEGVLVPADR